MDAPFFKTGSVTFGMKPTIIEKYLCTPDQ
jgi:hypothetical protein